MRVQGTCNVLTAEHPFLLTPARAFMRRPSPLAASRDCRRRLGLLWCRGQDEHRLTPSPPPSFPTPCCGLQAVSKSLSSFENRRSMPAAWRGLRDEVLSKESGIPGCV